MQLNVVDLHLEIVKSLYVINENTRRGSNPPPYYYAAETKKSTASYAMLFFVFSGQGGIRTPGTIASTLAFQASTFDHSVTGPCLLNLLLCLEEALRK